MQINKILFLIHLAVCRVIFSMEQQEIEDVIVIDQNADQSISSVVKEDAIVAFFGATPRYSAREQYLQNVIQDYKTLLGCYKKSKRMKGVEKGVEHNFKSLINDPKLSQLAESLLSCTASEEQKSALFFAAGFDLDRLKANFVTLIKTASDELLAKHQPTSKQNLYLVHVLVPSYFTDIKEDGHSDDLLNQLYEYLKTIANFYKKMYQPLVHEQPFTTCLVIPKLDYFKK